MNRKYKSGTWKKTIKDKILHFIGFTIVFSVIFKDIADKELTKLLNANNQTIFTYNYTVGPEGFLLVIPAALLSILLVIVLVSFRDRFFPGVTTRKVMVLTLKLIKLLGKGVKLLALGIAYLIFMVVNLFSGGGGSSSSGGGGSYYGGGSSYYSGGSSSSGGGGSYSGGGSNHSDDNRALKNEAEWQARQKQKEADYALKHAKIQAAYNARTHHLTNRVNRAASKQREANEAAKRARNL
ncbi:hypothetical protein SFC66_12395 [Terribacillus saccharophilus]|uniref:hypothetical protein n=1 Tax=Terribacillus saccharophilus TaxID=361277 RepID=UPI0039828504